MQRFHLFGPDGSYMNDAFGSGRLFMLFLFVLLWVALGVVAFLVVRHFNQPHATATTTNGSSSEAESVLHLRLAKGEINEEEYRSRIAALRATS